MIFVTRVVTFVFGMFILVSSVQALTLSETLSLEEVDMYSSSVDTMGAGEILLEIERTLINNPWLSTEYLMVLKDSIGKLEPTHNAAWDKDIDAVSKIKESILVAVITENMTKLSDTDMDGIPNLIDFDVDGDGITNDFDTDVDGDGIDNEDDMDIDGDRLSNKKDYDANGDGELDEVAEWEAQFISPTMAEKITLTVTLRTMENNAELNQSELNVSEQYMEESRKMMMDAVEEIKADMQANEVMKKNKGSMSVSEAIKAVESNIIPEESKTEDMLDMADMEEDMDQIIDESSVQEDQAVTSEEELDTVDLNSDEDMNALLAQLESIFEIELSDDVQEDTEAVGVEEMHNSAPVPETMVNMDGDLDGDWIPNSEDSDADGNGYPDSNDLDWDGYTNDVDGDDDGDGILDVADNDDDNDGIRDADDLDDDGDGIADAE